MPRISAYVVPTGGAIGVQFDTNRTGTIVLSRATSGVSGISSWMPLYSGAPLTETGTQQFYIDVGDLLPGPLVSGTTYLYRVIDTSGTVMSSGYQAGPRLVLESDPLQLIITRLMQAGINNLTVPASGQKCQVLQAMPIVGFPSMPFVVINNDITQQGMQFLSEDVETPTTDNVWFMNEFVKRTWRVSVMSKSALERDYYRDALISFYKMSLAYVFSMIGQNITHDWQSSSYQVSDETGAQVPGFYGADLLLRMEGNFNLKVITSYGLITHITADVSATTSVSGVSGVIQHVQVPLS